MGTEHFDERAATWDDDPDKIRTAQEVARAVNAAALPRAGSRLLEYGAGTGLVTQALVMLAGPLSITVADNSAGMRAVLEQKVASGALPADTEVWNLDLEHEPPPGEHFDLIVSSLVLHHVHDLDAVLRGFATLLDPGGTVPEHHGAPVPAPVEGRLCIADLDQEDGTFHTHDFDGHHGFDRSELAAALERNGFVDVTFTDCTQIDRDGIAYGVFLASARSAQ